MTSVQPETSPDRDRAAHAHAHSVAVWHAAWALGVGLGAGLLLTGLEHVPVAAVAALACGVIPGAAGWLLRPSGGNGVAVLVLWAIADAFAMALTGGVSGPLMVWSLGPVLAGAALGGLWRDGATLSFATLAGVALIQGSGAAAPLPEGALGYALGLIGLITTLAAAAAALMILTRAHLDALAIRDKAAEGPIADAPPSDAALLEQVARAEAARDAALADAQAKMRFLANMSHELRTPLNAVMGFSDIMRARLFGELAPKYAEYAELIHESGRHLLDLINDVLDMSKIEADKYELALERFDLREPVNAALRILRVQADDAGVHMRAVLPVHGVEVDADRRALKQIVLNLISNALKFTPAGGSVAVAAQTLDRTTIEIVVSDTGVGIAPEDLERFGRPYEQMGDPDQRARGTGLGLSLVTAFARLHGGDLAVESRLGEGTAVTVRLPIRTAAADEAAIA